jgi:hypothetical protein
MGDIPLASDETGGRTPDPLNPISKINKNTLQIQLQSFAGMVY